jgi:hypothetical protein
MQDLQGYAIQCNAIYISHHYSLTHSHCLSSTLRYAMQSNAMLCDIMQYQYLYLIITHSLPLSFFFFTRARYSRRTGLRLAGQHHWGRLRRAAGPCVHMHMHMHVYVSSLRLFSSLLFSFLLFFSLLFLFSFLLFSFLFFSFLFSLSILLNSSCLSL